MDSQQTTGPGESSGWYATPMTGGSHGVMDVEQGVSAPRDTTGATMESFWDTTGLRGQLLSTVFESTTQKAMGLGEYTNVSIIQPLFDVEQRDVGRRLVRSLLPRPATLEILERPDMYGPIVLAFTLAAILVMGMQPGGTVMQEGTRLGTSLGFCFTYWLGTSCAFFGAGNLVLSTLSLVQSMCIWGYGLFAFCVTLLLTVLLGPGVFLPLCLCIALPSAITLAYIHYTQTPDHSKGLLVGGAASVVHLSVLVFLHATYIQVYYS
eukprot:TRINITY_DN38712_c0_g1_i1.p1 TRINITY_DN38712_c0_g1~~TRINITY_DN38712_c0_g1_i1.p1  ORF type:complete len:272 (+),score=37.39 TRINITY_DN38712_c0_g1_i1:23-817(+)